MRYIIRLVAAIAVFCCSVANIDGMKIQSKHTERQNLKPYFDIAITAVSDYIKNNLRNDYSLGDLLLIINNNVSNLRFDRKFCERCEIWYNEKNLTKKEECFYRLIDRLKSLHEFSKSSINASYRQYSDRHGDNSLWNRTSSSSSRELPAQLRLMKFSDK